MAMLQVSSTATVENLVFWKENNCLLTVCYVSTLC